jgi:hypothetical protein
MDHGRESQQEEGPCEQAKGMRVQCSAGGEKSTWAFLSPLPLPTSF